MACWLRRLATAGTRCSGKGSNAVREMKTSRGDEVEGTRAREERRRATARLLLLSPAAELGAPEVGTGPC